MDPLWVKKIFTHANDMKNDETKRYQADLGEISQWFGEEEEREVSYAWFELLHMKLPDDSDLSKAGTLNTWKWT